MLQQTRSSRWMAVVFSTLFGLAGVGGCAWIMGHESQLQPTRSVDQSWDALPEPAPAPPPSLAQRPGVRDPFSRRMAKRYRTASAAAVGEAGALTASEPEVAGALAGSAALAGEGEGLVAGSLAQPPPVGAGPREDRNRRALWIAMCLVVAIGLSAMWLARRQSQA